MIANASALRILIVDDSVDVTEVLTSGLESRGHTVHAVLTGHDALRAISELRPDVAVIDISLEDMDGWTLAERICALALEPPVRLIALSGLDDPGDQERSRTAGFEAHLVKPIRMFALDAILRAPP